MTFQRVEGKKKGKIVLFALSTCGWCKKTKALLDELGVEYHYIFVDLASPDERQEVRDEVRRWNPNMSFPTMVIDDERVIVGFQEERIREELGA